MQQTLKAEITLSGRGLFTGQPVTICLCPAPVNSGVIFERVDLPGRPSILAHPSNVIDTMRCTRLGHEGGDVIMVEHLLSALSGFGIDNARILVNGPEIPVGDGSASLFCEAIEKVGTVVQKSKKRKFTLTQPLFYSQNDTHLIALPSNEFRVSYTLHHPGSALLCSQYDSICIQRDTYQKEISPCRTFALYEEIAPFLESGRIRGGGLENGVVIQNNRVMNPEGLRFHNEMVRHKILDLIGDLALTGKNLQMHIIAIRSGHTSNVAFAKKIWQIEETINQQLLMASP